jgi:hypothetical protein
MADGAETSLLVCRRAFARASHPHCTFAYYIKYMYGTLSFPQAAKAAKGRVHRHLHVARRSIVSCPRSSRGALPVLHTTRPFVLHPLRRDLCSASLLEQTLLPSLARRVPSIEVAFCHIIAATIRPVHSCWLSIGSCVSSRHAVHKRSFCSYPHVQLHPHSYTRKTPIQISRAH